MFVLTCAKHIYTQQIHMIICSSRQTYLAKKCSFHLFTMVKKNFLSYIKTVNTSSPSLWDSRYAFMILGWFRITFFFSIFFSPFYPLPWQRDRRAINKEQLVMEATQHFEPKNFFHVFFVYWENRLSLKTEVLIHSLFLILWDLFSEFTTLEYDEPR